MKPLRILRDVGIVFGLTLLGGFVIGVATAGSPRGPMYVAAIAISNLLFSTVGFFIAGCLTIENRWKHLALVGLGVWLASLVNVVFVGTTIIQWIFASIFVAITMGIGGGAAALVRRKEPNQPLQRDASTGSVSNFESPARRG